MSRFSLNDFFFKTNLFINGAANNTNKATNFDLCLIPVPKFPTPTAKAITYDTKINKISFKALSRHIDFKFFIIKEIK